MSRELLNSLEQKMKTSIDSFVYQLGGIRAGRANASLVERVNVNYYGADTPLNQLAQISVPEARVLLISPYDKSSLGDIEKAIQKSDIGISPANDGEVIRLIVPQLTEERRKEIAKRVGEEEENAKVSVRNIRREGMDSLKQSEKDNELSEDERRRFEKEVQDLTDKYIDKVDELSREKEQEILDN